MVEVIVALFLSFLVLWGLFYVSGVREGGTIWPVFLLLFLVIWVGGLWVQPFGPPVVGVYWLPFVMVAIFAGLFWAAMPPPPWRHREQPVVAARQEEERTAAVLGLGILFWVLLVGLALTALARYVWYV
jgi:hypothetical protein